jgi:hypothetical protein
MIVASLIGALLFGAVVVGLGMVFGLRARDGDEVAARRAAHQALLGGAALVALYGVAIVMHRSGGVLTVLGDDAFAIALLALAPLAVVALGGVSAPVRDDAPPLVVELPAPRAPRPFANGSREVELVADWSDPPRHAQAEVRGEGHP